MSGTPAKNPAAPNEHFPNHAYNTIPFVKIEPVLDKQSLRELHDHITHLIRARGCRTFFFAGFLAAQGTTSILTDIALTLKKTRPERSMLLLDTNSFHPELHNRFGTPISPGYGEILCGTVPFQNAIKHTPSALPLIPRGDTSVKPDMTADFLRMMQFIDIAKRYSDIILIDGGSFKDQTESYTLAALSDATFPVIASGTLNSHVARQVQKKLTDLNVIVAGTILNRFKHTIPRILY